MTNQTPPTHSARQRQPLKLQFDELLETLDVYEDLILRLADQEIEQDFDKVLCALSRTPGFDDLDDDAWPYSEPLRDAGFLEQLFWAKHEMLFVYCSDDFRKEVSRTSLRAIEARNWRQGPAFDLLMTACAITRSAPSPTDMEAWAADRLYRFVWDELMKSDMDILSDRGIRPSPGGRVLDCFEGD